MNGILVSGGCKSVTQTQHSSVQRDPGQYAQLDLLDNLVRDAANVTRQPTVH